MMSPQFPQPLDPTTMTPFIQTFFGLQLELLHQKLHTPDALPVDIQDSTPGSSPDQTPAEVSPERLHQLLRHWTMFAQPMVHFEHQPAQPGQRAWDQLLERVVHASNCYHHQTPEDQRNFAIAIVTPLTDWLTAGWQGYEQQQATLPWRGCFRADVDDAGVASLHFYNAVRPASPFTNLPERAGELAQIMDELRRHQGVRTVRMASWLNNLPTVQQLFPAEYVASLKPQGRYPNGLGWWGQIITRQGTVHPPKAEQIREASGFSYPRLQGSCPLDAWIK